jgi:transcriptional regulator GlxA family with amidase domain
MTQSTVRHMAVLAYPDVQILDVVGPLQVFASAGCTVEVIGLEPGPFRTSSGIQLVAERGFAQVQDGIDTLLVAGGQGASPTSANADLLAWLKEMQHRVRRLGSVCSGAFILGAAGLLDGRRAVTHWARCDEFRTRFPAVRLEPDALHIRDGHIYTSAGVTAGMDLALALVEEDLGREVALATARRLVMYAQRPGDQAQFSAPLRAQTGAAREPLREVQQWVAAHPEAECSVDALAARASMSPRNFARAFTRDVGTTPARWVEEVRVEAARLLLETTDRTVDAVAAATGFGTAETLRRAFARRLHVAPSDYRKRFRKEPAA